MVPDMAVHHPRVVIIGAGAGGLAAAVRLLEDGVEDLVVIDRADGVGGVWRANTYPGAQCDVPSHLYSLSFAPKPDWSQRFADGAEILAYLESVADDFALRPRLRLSTEVTSCRWDDDEHVWRVGLESASGPGSLTADIVIAAAGQLSAPAVPKLPGLDSFTGPVFHSARWRHDVDLTGRRVAVIGTGASAIQFVPEVARQAGHTDLYQRSAPYIIGKNNRRYSALEKKVYARWPATLKASRLRQYLWQESLGTPFVIFPPLMVFPRWDWRRRMHRDVADPGLRAAVQPDYTMGCKRLLRSDEWYSTLTRPDVDLVTDAIGEVTPEGIRTADGELHPADVIILGTGFDATRFLTPMTVTGTGGRDLNTEWQHGAHAYLGTVVAGFPNLFLVYGPGTNLGHTSILYMIESQLTWIRSAVRTMREVGLQWIDVRPEVASAYDRRFRKASRRTVWETGCESWYTVEGRNTNNWPAYTWVFRMRTRRLHLTDVDSGPVGVLARSRSSQTPR